MKGIEAALHDEGDGDGGGERGQHGASVIGGVHIIDAQRGRGVLKFDLAGDADGAGADGTLGGVDGAEDGHLEQQRGKQRVVDHLHLVALDGFAGAREVEGDGHHGGTCAEFAGDGGVAVLVDGAHPFLGGGDFEGGVGVGEQREDFGAREREGGGADIEEAVAEGVDAIAVDVGDGAVGADGEIAGHHLDADHGAGLEVGGIAHGGRGLCRRW